MGGDPKQTRRKTALYALGLFGSLLAVAMWGKMRFVTDLPRMAYAVPEDQIASSETESLQALDNETSEATTQNPDQEREPDQDVHLDPQIPESGGF
jgi:hypothetical protein